MIDDISYVDPIGKSDHLTMEWVYNCYAQKGRTQVKKFLYNKAHYENIRISLVALDWDHILSGKSVNDQWMIFSDILTELVCKFVPSRNFTLGSYRRKRPAWTNDKAITKIKKKKAVFERYKQTREWKDYLEYAKARNAAKAETRRAIREYEREVAKQAKKNPKAFFRYVNGKLKNQSGFPNLKDVNGKEICSDLEKAEAFNAFFSGVFTREDATNVPCVDHQSYTAELLTTIDIEESQVLNLLKKLQPDKSPGSDGIHPHVLKECAAELTKPLSIIFRSSLCEGQLPQSWKEANVTPIYKKGSRSSVGNYRPVSLTSVCCKVLEKLVRNALLSHMIDNGLLSDYQHGFVHGRSCTTQLLRVIDKWTEILDQGGAVDAVYLDFAKAFDTVPHMRLMTKLERYGVSGKLLEWIRQFLIGRKQRVGVAGSFSEWTMVLSGVPQGSVLGPVLFLCYINDMPEMITSMIYMYADDTKLFRRIDDDCDRAALQKDLDHLSTWSEQWQLRFNVDKCNIMHIGGSRNLKASYTMGSTTLQATNEEKDLGIWIDSSVKPSNHVAHAVTKANQMLGLIRRTFTYMDCELMKQLFTNVVRPHLEYGNVVWHPFLKQDIELLEGVQHRATRMVPGLAKFPYAERLRKMDLPSLAYRRTRGDAIEVYKYLHNIYRDDCSDLLPLHESSSLTTRGHSLKLAKRSSRTQLRQNFFSNRVVNMWNDLPQEVVMAPTVNCFKGRFDRYSADNRYSMEWRYGPPENAEETTTQTRQFVNT